MKNEKLDTMIDLAWQTNRLYNDADTGFIGVLLLSYGPEIQIKSKYFDRYFGDAGTVYMEDEEYIRKEAYYNGVRFVALFHKEGEGNAND